MKVLIPMLGMTPHGGNRVLAQIANEFVASGHRCRVIHPREVPSFPFLLDSRVEVVSVGPRIDIKALRWLMLSIALPYVARNSDCLVANHFVTAIPARFIESWMKKTVVCFVQGIEFEVLHPIAQGPAKWLSMRAWRLRNLVPANAHLEARLREFGANPQQCTGMGIDPFFLEPPAEENRTNKQYGAICFLRHERYKRLDRTIAIALSLRQAGISVLGVSQDEGLLKKHADCFASVLKPREDGELRAALDSSRLLIYASDVEGFALPPLEGMARGLPAVLFPCGGSEAYADDGTNCVVVKDERVETAVQSTIELLRDLERYACLSSNAVATAQRFDMRIAARRFVQRCEAAVADGYAR